MPELPEVETIVRGMRQALVGKKLKRVFVFDKKLSRPNVRLPLKVESIERLGKYIICNMSEDVCCLVHLRMTGQLFYEKFADRRGLWRRAPTRINAEKRKIRAAFLFSDGSVLHFFDTRRFGTVDWLRGTPCLPQLGPDPLSRGFNAKSLGAILENSSGAIKSLLLDQHLVAGMGNIYADESLWLAKIYPRRESSSLKPVEARRLTLAIKKTLKEAIKKGGFTLRDYRRLDGSRGHYQESRKVYDREGLPCLPRVESRGFRCHAKIRKIRVGGRSTYFCPACQRPKP